MAKVHHATKAKWARFWATQEDAPIVLAWAPTQPEQKDERPQTRSVVAQTYKREYQHNGTKGRGCGDALYDALVLFLNAEGKLDVSAFEALLTENGVRHEAWKREGNGWQGRFRMSGSVALRSKMKRGEPLTWNGSPLLV